MRISARRLMGAGIFLVALSVYIATMPRTIFLGDSAEFIAAGVTLGVPHAPGYPLYVLLAKLFTFLPVGSVEFRITLLSGLAASVGLVLLYLFLTDLRKLKNHSIPESLSENEYLLLCAGVVLVLGFSDIFWSQAIYAKVYALGFLFISLMMWLLGRFLHTGKKGYVLALAISCGLGVAVHPMLALFLPLLVVAVGLKQAALGMKTWFAAGALLVLGVSVYGLLPVFSMRQPAVDFGATHRSVEAFLNHILRVQYADYGSWTGWRDKLNFFSAFAQELYHQFGALLLLALLGGVALVWFHRLLGVVTIGIFLANSLGIILLRALPFSLVAQEFYRPYYLPAFAVVAVWIAVGAIGMFALLQWRWTRVAKFSWVMPVCMVMFALTFLLVNYSKHNLSTFRFLEDYSKGLLTSLPPNTVLLLAPEGSETDTLLFSLLYQHAVRKVRPDITVVGYVWIFPTDESKAVNAIYAVEDLGEQRRQLVAYAIGKQSWQDRPIYTTFFTDGLDPAWSVQSNGLVYRLVTSPSNVAHPLTVSPMVLSDSDRMVLERDFFGKDLLALYYFAQAAHNLEQGEFPASQELYIRAINADNEPAGKDSTSYRLHREKVLSQQRKAKNI